MAIPIIEVYNLLTYIFHYITIDLGKTNTIENYERKYFDEWGSSKLTNLISDLKKFQ